MKLFDYTEPKMIVADKGKHIRSVNDVYIEEHYDDEGNLVEEHSPYYATVIFVPDNTTEKEMYEMYIEEQTEE